MRTWKTGGAVLGLVLTVTLVVVLALSVSGAGSHAARPALVGQHAPGLTGTTLEGRRFRLGPRPATVTVVNIWASWCGPCRQELPLLARIAADRWSSDQVRLVTIDTRDGPVAARTLLHEVGATNLLAVQDPRGHLAVSWGATGVPETVVVDDRGIVRARWMGPLRRGWLDQQLQRWSPS